MLYLVTLGQGRRTNPPFKGRKKSQLLDHTTFPKEKKAKKIIPNAHQKIAHTYVRYTTFEIRRISHFSPFSGSDFVKVKSQTREMNLIYSSR